jgi:predicted extracellular nuclease
VAAGGGAVAAASGSTSAWTPTGTLRVGCWNIEWLGRPESRSGVAANVAQSAEDLADCIADSGVDVLALAEITTLVRGEPIRSREIEATIDKLNALRPGPWMYVLLPGRARGDQLTGVMWNSKALTALGEGDKPWDEQTDKPWAVPVDLKARSSQGGVLWARPPHAMKFRVGAEKTDFVLIPVHMKADYEGDFASHRREEAALLAGALEAVRAHFHDRDVIVLGDTNTLKDREPAIGELEGAGLADLNRGQVRTHWRSGAMDRVLVPADQPEFKARRFESPAEAYLRKRGMDAKEFKRRLSDHFLVYSTIDIGQDDD